MGQRPAGIIPGSPLLLCPAAKLTLVFDIRWTGIPIQKLSIIRKMDRQARRDGTAPLEMSGGYRPHCSPRADLSTGSHFGRSILGRTFLSSGVCANHGMALFVHSRKIRVLDVGQYQSQPFTRRG